MKPLDADDARRLGRFDLVVTVEDGYARAASGRQSPQRWSSGPSRRRARPDGRAVLGVPVRFIPHGKPDDILADLGLDGPGLAAEARRMLGR